MFHDEIIFISADLTLYVMLRLTMESLNYFRTLGEDLDIYIST